MAGAEGQDAAHQTAPPLAVAAIAAPQAQHAARASYALLGGGYDPRFAPLEAISRGPS